MINRTPHAQFLTGFALIFITALSSGCLQSSVTGAGLAQVLTYDEAAQADGPSLSIVDDKFDGIRVVRLQKNLIPNVDGTIFNSAHFDGACVNQKCYVLIHLGEIVRLTQDFKRLHLNIDGVIIKGLKGRKSIKAGKDVIEGALIARLNAETLRAIVAAKEITFRIETRDDDNKSKTREDDDTYIDGVLSRKNVLNFRELLNLAEVDPWATEHIDAPLTPSADETVGSPPPR